MEKNNRLYFRGIICFLFILGISINAAIVLAQEDDITWVTSRDEAISTALNEGKYILLVAGSDT